MRRKLIALFLSIESTTASVWSFNNNNNTSSLIETQPTVVGQGRFGHSSIYVPSPVDQVWIFGGQLNSSSSTQSSVTTTDSVLEFNVRSSLVWERDRDPTSSIADNPTTTNPRGNFTTSGRAFMGATLVEQEEGESRYSLWSFGGIGRDDDPVTAAFDFNSSKPLALKWTTTRVPPRRRQVEIVPMLNLSTRSDDLWVFGGIADRYSGLSDSLGSTTTAYVGVDRWNTRFDTVESFEWTRPTNSNETTTTFDPPVSDYRATALTTTETGGIAVIGGQTANGRLVDLNEILVFDVELRRWSYQTVTASSHSDTPAPRMGHVAVRLGSGDIVVHGGLDKDHEPLDDVYLLSTSTWTWTRLVTSDDSVASPALAYHAATRIDTTDTVVVSFGLGPGAQVSDDFYFLTVDETAGTYTWKDTFGGVSISTTATATATRLDKRDEIKAMVKRVEVVANPKHSDSSSSTLSPVIVGGGQGAISSSSSSPRAVVASSASPRAVSSTSLAAAAAAAATNVSASTNANSKSSSSDGAASTKIGASVGASLGALVVVGSIAYFALARHRRRRSRNRGEDNDSRDFGRRGVMTEHDHQGGRGGGPPLVSSLMYTRPVQSRMLSLGSTISELPSVSQRQRGDGDDDDGGDLDPFSDDHNVVVNELGQFEQQQAIRLERSKSSVTSIPFLSTIARDFTLSSPVVTKTEATDRKQDEEDDDDKFTRRPTSSAKNLRRESTLRRSLLPMPETPAELIGVAITSDDGHVAQPSSSSSSSPWEQEFLQQTKNTPSTTMGGRVLEEEEQRGGGLPAVLRPATPLRVTNADPFKDQ
ncbi:hypothetical protein JCM3766R1_003533 [Sporobolomyces carnicolor]